MDLGSPGELATPSLLFLAVTAAVAAGTSFLVFLACFYWFRREQKRVQSRLLSSLAFPPRNGPHALKFRSPQSGELVAQFKAKEGKQVISVLEADGKRFLHIDGEISAPERARMIHYLKSEGFMS